MKVGIIGAGPAGLTAALQLSRKGARVVVFEKERNVGGMCKTIPLWGQKVDLGPHRFFTTQPHVRSMWFKSIGDSYHLVDRQTRILYRKSFFDYPLRPVNVLQNLGLADSTLSFLSYCRQHIGFRNSKEATFESWISDRFGHQLYEKFFKTYSEKLWGIPCSELDADFAIQRIRSFSLWEAVKSAIQPQKGGHRTLVDQFAYPTEGAGMVYEKMAAEIEQSGGVIKTNAQVKAVVREGGTVRGIRTDDGSYHSFDHIISTMDLPLLLSGLKSLPDEVKKAAAQLTYRNTLIVYLHLNSNQLFPDQWIYVHSPELAAGRITNFRNWVPEIYGGASTSILALEYWCYDHDAIWGAPDKELVQKAADELTASGLRGNAQVLDGHVLRIKNSYPVYRVGYKETLDPIVRFLKQMRGLSVIGRSGSFKYNNQDHSILMGMMAAENLLFGGSHDLWKVNTDGEYQEAGAGFSTPAAADTSKLPMAKTA